MIDELITIEQLERLRRLIKADQRDMAVAMLEAMIDARKERVEQFELEVQGGMNT